MHRNAKRLSIRLPWGAADAIDELAEAEHKTANQIVADIIKKQLRELSDAGILKMPSV